MQVHRVVRFTQEVALQRKTSPRRCAGCSGISPANERRGLTASATSFGSEFAATMREETKQMPSRTTKQNGNHVNTCARKAVTPIILKPWALNSSTLQRQTPGAPNLTPVSPETLNRQTHRPCNAKSRCADTVDTQKRSKPFFKTYHTLSETKACEARLITISKASSPLPNHMRSSTHDISLTVTPPEVRSKPPRRGDFSFRGWGQSFWVVRGLYGLRFAGNERGSFTTLLR